MKHHGGMIPLLAAIAVTAFAGTVAAQSPGSPDCSGTHEYLLSWPDEDPVLKTGGRQRDL